MTDDRGKIEALVRDLSAVGQQRCSAAVQDVTALLAAAQLAGDQGRVRALAEEVVLADGILPLLRLVQRVDYDARTLRPRKSADPDAAVLAEAALDCCSLLCTAAASALERHGWELVEAPEDGRPAYLHEASNVLRNSAPDITWPPADGEESAEGAEGGKTWSQQLLLDLPTLIVPMEGADAGAVRRRGGRQRGRGSLRWPVKVLVHEPASHSVLDVIVDGQADCLFRQLIRHDTAGAWRHTEGSPAVEVELQADGQLSPNADLLSWSKTTMAMVPLLLRANQGAEQPAAVPAPGEAPLQALVVGTSNCCDLLGFYARYLPSLTVAAVEAGDERAAKRLRHLSEHFGLPAERCASTSCGHPSLAEALGALADRGNETARAYDFVAMDLASEASCSAETLLGAAGRLLASGGVFTVGVGSNLDLAAGLQKAAEAAGLSVLALLADAGAREDGASAEAVLLLAKGREARLKADDVSPEAWESALGDSLGRVLAHPLPMKIDSVEEDSDAEREDEAEPIAHPLGRIWLFWSEAERERQEQRPPDKEVAADDTAWDIFGGQGPDEPVAAAEPAPAPEPDSQKYWLPLLPDPLQERIGKLLQASVFAPAGRCAEAHSGKPPGAPVPAMVLSGELQASLKENGYATCPSPTGAGSYAELVPSLFEAVVALVQGGLPPAMVYMYDVAWEFVLRLWPVAEAILEGPCVLEPSFAAFRLDHGKSSANRRYVGNNFPKPHRNYSHTDSIDASTGALKVLSVWVPLNEVTLRNGCMYVVPRAKDANFSDPISREGLQEPVVPEDGIEPLAPHPAGTFMCWSGNTIHWGSSCEREGAADPRTSLAFVFRRCGCELSQREASLTKEDAQVSLAEGCGLRLERVARAVHFFGHWYPVPDTLQQLLSAAGPQHARGRKRARE